MFTGIIEGIGELFRVEEREDGRQLSIRSPLAAELTPGQSVAHNGVCLTIEQAEQESYRVTVIAESLGKSTLGQFRPGERLNIERALTFQGRLEGHFVQGHVDAVAKIERADIGPERRQFWISCPPSFDNLVVERGSIAIDGISLTIAEHEPQKSQLLVAIIPHTWQNSNAACWKEGREVNIEFDILAKHIERYVGEHIEKHIVEYALKHAGKVVDTPPNI